jgi:hypothetical protein
MDGLAAGLFSWLKIVYFIGRFTKEDTYGLDDSNTN